MSKREKVVIDKTYSCKDCKALQEFIDMNFKKGTDAQELIIELDSDLAEQSMKIESIRSFKNVVIVKLEKEIERLKEADEEWQDKWREDSDELVKLKREREQIFDLLCETLRKYVIFVKKNLKSNLGD